MILMKNAEADTVSVKAIEESVMVEIKAPATEMSRFFAMSAVA